MIVDTHVHVVSDDENRFPLDPAGDLDPWYREEPCTVEQLLALMDAAGVDAAVLVQAGTAYQHDNRYVLDAARRSGSRCTAVVGVDQNTSGAATELTRLVTEAGARGQRWVAASIASMRELDEGLFSAAPVPIDEPLEVWESAARLGIPMLVVVLPDRLDELGEALARLPRIPVVLDHGGLVDPRNGAPPELLALAHLEHVSLKLTTVALRLAEAHGDPADYVKELATHFGASRLLWGSDWAHTRMWPYGEIVEYGRRAAAKLGEQERAWYLGRTALRLWPELMR